MASINSQPRNGNPPLDNNTINVLIDSQCRLTGEFSQQAHPYSEMFIIDMPETIPGNDSYIQRFMMDPTFIPFSLREKLARISNIREFLTKNVA